MKRLIARLGVRVLAQLGIELGHEPHPGRRRAPAASHPVFVVNGRVNARRFICSNPGAEQ